MTFVVLIVALLVALSLAGGWYFRRKEAGVLESRPIWDRMIRNINRLVADESVPFDVARDLTVFASLAGCGCFVLAVIRDQVTRDISKQYERSAPATEWESLTLAQKQAVGVVLADLLMMDMLHMPVLRVLFNALLKSALAGEEDKDRRAQIEGIRTMLFTAHYVAERRLVKHRVPHQALLPAGA